MFIIYLKVFPLVLPVYLTDCSFVTTKAFRQATVISYYIASLGLTSITLS